MVWKGVLLSLSVLFAAQMASGGELTNDVARVRVKSTAEVGEGGSVVARDSESWIVGSLTATDADYLTVTESSDPHLTRRLPRNAVQHLQVSQGRSRGKPALIGAGIGLVAGLVWGAVENSRCKSQGDGWCDLAWGLPMLTVPAGGILGLAIGKERWVAASPTTLGLGVIPEPRGVRVVGAVRF